MDDDPLCNHRNSPFNIPQISSPCITRIQSPSNDPNTIPPRFFGHRDTGQNTPTKLKILNMRRVVRTSRTFAYVPAFTKQFLQHILWKQPAITMIWTVVMVQDPHDGDQMPISVGVHDVLLGLAPITTGCHQPLGRCHLLAWPVRVGNCISCRATAAKAASK